MNSIDANRANGSVPVEPTVLPADADAALLVSVRQELERSCNALDGYTLSRLHGIRSAAVARRPGRMQSLLFPLSSMVAACALVVAVSLNWQPLSSETELSGTTPLVDIEILTDNEALDFYEEYEFYQWLAQN
jgi:hypothetical protein